MKMQKQMMMAVCLWLIALPLQAQTEKEVQLDSVTVEAARVVSRPDGKLFVPSEAQKRASTNGYSLLAKLPLAGLRVDEVMRSVAVLDGRGEVQLRLNGAVASRQDLLALDAGTVRSVEFIDNPGVRYGPGVAYVVNIRTRRARSGGMVGVDASNSVTTRYGDNAVYGRLNRGDAEIGFDYDFGYSDFRGSRFDELASYMLTDGSRYDISRRDEAARSRSYRHSAELKFSLADSASNVLQASLQASLGQSPGDWQQRRIADGSAGSTAFIRSHGRNFSPVADLYAFRHIGRGRTVTVNIVGTAIGTRSHRLNTEGSPYAYDVQGRTWSLLSEAIYEHRLRPLTLSFGARHKWKYTRNAYTGSVESLNRMHNSSLYLFGEAKGNWHKWAYVAGLGATNERYRQGSYSYNRWLFMPRLTLTYEFAPSLSVRYMVGVESRLSQVAMVSDTRIRQNSMEWTVGNPYLKPTSRLEHSLRIAWNVPRLSNSLNIVQRLNRHPNMASYTRTDNNEFLYTQKNQRSIDMFYVSDDVSWDIVPRKLTFQASAGIYRFFNRGDDYRHYLTAYNVQGSMQAYLGRWTLTAYADNGWRFMEGETRGRQGAATYVGCSYRAGNLTLSAYWQHPLEKNPTMVKDEVVNRYVWKQIMMRGTDYGNALMLNVAWRLSRGRKFREVQRQLKNEDRQTGIM